MKISENPRARYIAKTTNLVENVNKQLWRRYKTIEAFQFRSTAIHYPNRLKTSLIKA